MYLDINDPAPVMLLNELSTRPLLLIVDHAGNAVPRSMNGLGLGEEELTRHIAWDPGAAVIAKGLAEKLRCTCVLAQYSRLIVDPNRPLGDPAAIPIISDGTKIPANRSLSGEEYLRRARLFFFPYHQAIDEEIARLRRIGPGPLILAVHSFTPNYRGEDRPWQIGVMSASDRRLAERLLYGLRTDDSLVVGDNEPYSGVELGYTLRHHGGAQGLANAQIEIRQDLLTQRKDTIGWVEKLDSIISPLVDDPSLQAIEFS